MFTSWPSFKRFGCFPYSACTNGRQTKRRNRIWLRKPGLPPSSASQESGLTPENLPLSPDEDLAQLSVDEREQFLGANSLKRRTRMIIPIDAGGFPRAVVASLTGSMCCLI